MRVRIGYVALDTVSCVPQSSRAVHGDLCDDLSVKPDPRSPDSVGWAVTECSSQGPTAIAETSDAAFRSPEKDVIFSPKGRDPTVDTVEPGAGLDGETEFGTSTESAPIYQSLRGYPSPSRF